MPSLLSQNPVTGLSLPVTYRTYCHVIRAGTGALDNPRLIWWNQSGIAIWISRSPASRKIHHQSINIIHLVHWGGETPESRYVTTVCLSEWKTTKLLWRWWVSDFATNLWQSEQWPCHGWGVTLRDRGQSNTQSNSPLRHHLRRWQFKFPTLSESCLGGKASFCFV